MKRTRMYVLAATLGLGVVARIWELGKRGLWYDELYCVVGPATSASIAQLRHLWMDVDGHPPGFMLGLYAWFKLVPATEITGRLPGCLTSLLTIALLCYVARAPRWALPSGVGYYAAALYAVGTEPIYYAQTVRQYGIVMACSIGALLEWMLLYEDPSADRTAWVRLVAWLLLAAYLHYLALLLVGAIFGIALLRALAVRRGLLAAVISPLAFCLAYVPGFLSLQRAIGWRIAGWQQSDPLLRVTGELLVRGFFGPGWWILGLVFVIILAIARTRGEPVRERLRKLLAQPKFRAVSLVLLAMVAEFAILSRMGPFVQLRYALVLYAPMLLTFAWVMAEFVPFERPSGVLLLSGMLAMGLVAYREYRQTRKQDWRRSAEFVIRERSAHEPVFVLGADPTVAPEVYLRNGQVDDYFSCRHLPFYAFYFTRLGSPALAAELRSLPISSQDLTSILMATSTARAFVLAPHHTHLEDASLNRLKAAGFEVDDVGMFSTHLYRIRAAHN
jgi:hypothetical protein